MFKHTYRKYILTNPNKKSMTIHRLATNKNSLGKKEILK